MMLKRCSSSYFITGVEDLLGIDSEHKSGEGGDDDIKLIRQSVLRYSLLQQQIERERGKKSPATTSSTLLEDSTTHVDDMWAVSLMRDTPVTLHNSDADGNVTNSSADAIISNFTEQDSLSSVKASNEIKKDDEYKVEEFHERKNAAIPNVALLLPGVLPSSPTNRGRASITNKEAALIKSKIVGTSKSPSRSGGRRMSIAGGSNKSSFASSGNKLDDDNDGYYKNMHNDEEKMECILGKGLESRSIHDITFLREHTANVEIFQVLYHHLFVLHIGYTNYCINGGCVNLS